MSLLALAGTNSATGGYDIDNSIKTQANAGNEWFYRSSPTIGNKRTFTFSFWIKRTQLTGYQADAYLMSQGSNARFHFAGDSLRFMFDGGTTELEAPGKLRDTAAWYHIVLAVDTTQSTAANRVKAYLNGQDYDWNNTKYPTQNQESSWMSGTNMYFNTRDGDGSYDNSGYWSEVVVVDGQQLDPTSFGEYDEDSGIWKPKDLSDLTFGSEGFYYKFDNASSLGEDSSGNGNDATLNNITAADQATDTPTNNFCTLNPLDNNWANVPIIDEGATNHHSDSANFEGSSGTIAVSSGKWYWEIKTIHSDGNVYMLGIGSTEYGEVPGTQSPHDVLNFAGLYLANSGTEGGLFVTDSTGGSVYRNAFNPGANYSANDIYGFALDLDSSPQTITFYRNGTNINPSSGAPLDIAGACSILPVTIRLSIYEREAQCNFGGYTEFSISSAASDANGYGTFEYAPPSGYYALCTKNLEEYG